MPTYLHNLKSILGADGVELLWLSKTIATPFIHHPVSQRRAKDILDSIRTGIEIQTKLAKFKLLANQAG